METASNEFNGRDLSQEKAIEFGLPMFGSIRDALLMGGDKLAVDGVIFIGEHGYYPSSEFGVKLYPRKEMFDEIVSVFQETGQSVPVFCDKHLSWNSEWAQEMYETAKKMDFPLFAGSSISWAGTIPDIYPKTHIKIEEAVAIYYGGYEVYGIHSLEFLQSIVELRGGGEAGIKTITAYIGDQVWAAMERGEFSSELFKAALGVAQHLKEGNIRELTQSTDSKPWEQPLIAYIFEHRDGLKSTHVMLEGAVADFTAAYKHADTGEIMAGCSYSSWGGPPNHYGHFATLCSRIDQMMLTGKAPCASERTLLTTRAIAACVIAVQQPGIKLETPELMISYTQEPMAQLVSDRVRMISG